MARASDDTSLNCGPLLRQRHPSLHPLRGFLNIPTYQSAVDSSLVKGSSRTEVQVGSQCLRTLAQVYILPEACRL